MAKKMISLKGLGLLFLLSLAACSTTNNQQDLKNSIETSSISGGVYFDENMNEDCEECECGIEDIPILLFKEVCSGTMWQTVKTDVDGAFQFNELDGGFYCVTPDLPPTCDGFMPTTSIAQQVTLDQGEDIELTWFGYTSFVEIQPEGEE